MNCTELLICTTCRPAPAQRDAPAAGRLLFEAVQDALASARPGSGPMPHVRGIACLSGCARACTVAVQAPGKHTYVFADLQADTETAVQVLALAVLHQASADGSLPRELRPQRLRKGILAKLPPIQSAGSAAHQQAACGSAGVPLTSPNAQRCSPTAAAQQAADGLTAPASGPWGGACLTGE